MVTPPTGIYLYPVSTLSHRSPLPLLFFLFIFLVHALLLLLPQIEASEE